MKTIKLHNAAISALTLTSDASTLAVLAWFRQTKTHQLASTGQVTASHDKTSKAALALV